MRRYLPEKLAGRTRAKSIIVTDFDERDDAERMSLEDARRKMAKLTRPVRVVTLDALIAFGRLRRWDAPAKHPDGDGRLAAVIYTSGSTGTPKGALLTEYHCRTHCWGNAGHVPQITLAYAPFHHMQGRVGAYGTLAQGGTVYFTLRSDMSTLLEDIRIVRPTHFAFLPRITGLAYQHFQNQLLARQQNSRDDPDDITRQVMAEMKSSFLGDRLFFASLGSAPTAPEVKSFIADCFGAAFAEGYGSTEAGVITVLDRVFRKNVLDYKLVDVAALGYYTADRPYPRGELVVKTKMLVSGYFKHPELDAMLFNEDGFLRTGDIFEERGPDHIVWLDRKNNVLKLAQGEFVAIGVLEAAFVSATALIKQIYIHGNGYRSCLVAVVVPDIDVAMRRLGHEPTDGELAELMRSAFQEASQKFSFRRFEVPRDFIVERELFSYENGLLSGIGKPLRPGLKRKYAERLEALYEEIETNQQKRLDGLKDYAGRISTRALIGKALEASLGLGNINADAPRSFVAMGGDSLGAVSFSLLLEDIFGVSVPVSDILSPAASIHSWAEMIDQMVAGGASLASLATVFEQDAKIIHAQSLKLPLFLCEEFLDRTPPKPPAGITRTVLLTGANGFLGRQLCMELLQWAESNEGRVICLVRAPDALAARVRIEAALDTDEALSARFRLLADRHLEVVAGDLAARHFGMDDAQYDRLCGQVDHIVHPASLVNHRLAFRHLVGPNVTGTAELIKLALTGRQKRFDYVSSIGVVMSCEDPGAAFESCDIRALKPSFAINDGYANGYIASKWAGEVLLAEAHAQFGLPVNIFRPSMILAHRNHRGQINASDVFFRLIYSVALTGLAPRSFYYKPDSGHSAAGHYDGLPVDLISGFIAGMGMKPATGFHSYNIVNTNYGDGVSLDRIIGWIASAGVKLAYIDTLPAWVERIEQALRNLPEDQRQASALQILDAFRYPAPVAGIKLPAGAFESGLRELPVGPQVPQLDERFVHKCLDDFRVLGLCRGEFSIGCDCSHLHRLEV